MLKVLQSMRGCSMDCMIWPSMRLSTKAMYCCLYGMHGRVAITLFKSRYEHDMNKITGGDQNFARGR